MAEDRSGDMSRRPFGYDEDYKGPAMELSEGGKRYNRYQEMLRGMDDIVTNEYEADSHTK